MRSYRWRATELNCSLFLISCWAEWMGHARQLIEAPSSYLVHSDNGKYMACDFLELEATSGTCSQVLHRAVYFMKMRYGILYHLLSGIATPWIAESLHPAGVLRPAPPAAALFATASRLAARHQVAMLSWSVLPCPPSSSARKQNDSWLRMGCVEWAGTLFSSDE